jgi:hypothetical protein
MRALIPVHAGADSSACGRYFAAHAGAASSACRPLFPVHAGAISSACEHHFPVHASAIFQASSMRASASSRLAILKGKLYNIQHPLYLYNHLLITVV